MVAVTAETRRVFLRIFTRTICVLVAASLTLARPAAAQAPQSYIRDAEIETIIRTYATPIFTAAGLDAQAVHIYIVNDPRLNAFVAGGQNLFINTGTLLRAESPNQLVGIIAHETGHIAGGHLARSEEAMRNASIEGIIAMAVAGHGGATAGGAVLGGGQVAERSFLQYSVTQEASADQAGLTFLDRTHQSARGLLQFFQILEGEEVLSAQRQDPYLRSHPLTQQRVDTVREAVARSQWSDAKDPPDWVMMHKRMKAKLGAFLGEPSQVLAQLPADSNSLPVRYARAVAYYRIPDLKRALPTIDELIKESPEDPYFHELKGQMLFENGRIAEAVGPYDQAVKLKPDNALLRVELAQVQLESNDPKLVPRALAQLNEAVRFEDRNPEVWRLLAVAHGRSGNMGMMALSLAEQGMAGGDWKSARQQAQRAMKLLPPGPARQQAQDIADEAKRNKDKER
jgi:predicted Zn-dependent protease